ncbi:MAG: DUF45 domain-containing protein [Clostridia bacterium]|nr:DUF45 domain-containing protein [Clostridia bacterium]
MKNKTVFAALTLQGREIPYTWVKKAVKNINLRIRADGSVTVSSPHKVTHAQIEAFLTEKAHFILQALDRLPPPTEPFTLSDGSCLTILGKERTLCFKEGVTRPVMTDSVLLLPKETDRRRIEAMIRACAEAELTALLTALCHELYPLFRDATPFPEIRLRMMKRCHANCRPREHILTFNRQLIFYPPHFIRYVVMHEFTHFIVADHSAAFYRILNEKMPDAEQAHALGSTVRPLF